MAVGHQTAQMLSDISRVCADMTKAIKTLDKPPRQRTKAPMARRDRARFPQAGRIDRRMDFGCLAISGAVDTGSLSPPFREAATVCAVQIAASTRAFSGSGSGRVGLDRACRLQRTLPNPGNGPAPKPRMRPAPIAKVRGRSRQGQAFCANHKIASGNSRLSAPVRA